MDNVIFKSGLKVGTRELNNLSQLLIDNFKSFVSARMAGGGVVMRTSADTSFQVTINGSGYWTVAKGIIINDDNEVIRNKISSLEPAAGKKPGNLVSGNNPLQSASGTTQWIVVKTKDLVQDEENGTISVTGSSNAIVGSDTEFTKYFEPGGKIRVAGGSAANNGDYTISSVTDDTHMTTTTNFSDTQSGLRFSAIGAFFSGYPSGGDDETTHIRNSFSFRTTASEPTLAAGEYVLAKCVYDGGWSIDTDERLNNLFTQAQIRTDDVLDGSITLGKMASNSVDHNKIKAEAFGESISGGGGTQISVAEGGIAEAMLAENIVSLAKMKSQSVDENKLKDGVGDGATISGGAGSKLSVVEQDKFFAFLGEGSSVNIASGEGGAKIVFGETAYNINSKYNVSSGRFSPGKIGKYNVSAQLCLDAFSMPVSDYIELALAINGSADYYIKRIYGDGNDKPRYIGFSFDMYNDNASNYFEIFIKNLIDATTLTVFGKEVSGAYRSFFSAHRLL